MRGVPAGELRLCPVSSANTTARKPDSRRGSARCPLADDVLVPLRPHGGVDGPLGRPAPVFHLGNERSRQNLQRILAIFSLFCRRARGDRASPMGAGEARWEPEKPEESEEPPGIAVRNPRSERSPFGQFPWGDDFGIAPILHPAAFELPFVSQLYESKTVPETQRFIIGLSRRPVVPS
jgi:hypothetical protein